MAGFFEKMVCMRLLLVKYTLEGPVAWFLFAGFSLFYSCFFFFASGWGEQVVLYGLDLWLWRLLI